jgi:hypothetical protein
MQPTNTRRSITGSPSTYGVVTILRHPLSQWPPGQGPVFADSQRCSLDCRLTLEITGPRERRSAAARVRCIDGLGVTSPHARGYLPSVFL